MQERTTRGGVMCCIKPINALNPILNIDAYILQRLCSPMPTRTINDSDWSHFAKLDLADPKFTQPGAIDLLLGAEVFPHILRDGRVFGKPNDPVAINTIFGYIIMGKYSQETPAYSTTLFAQTQTDLFAINETLKQFWDIEELPREHFMSPEDKLCETIFGKTHTRDETGRYIVELPFKNFANILENIEPAFDLENSRNIATRRFYSLENRLISNPSLYREYSKIIQEYLDADFQESVPHSLNSENGFYIPHHCVIKPEKLRIVYDASVKLNDGLSLNDSLLTGQKLQRDIVKLLLNFRIPNIVFTCDIKSMFTQIKVSEKHYKFQRIIWRFSKTEPLKEYIFKRVIFGLACSPFLANRTIVQLARDEKDRYPLGAQILENSIFVDDIATGVHTLDEAKELRNQLYEILRSGGFSLANGLVTRQNY